MTIRLIKCKQATRLMSDAQDRPLSLGEKAGLRVHLLTCEPCRRFGGQMDVLRQGMRRLADLGAGPDSPDDPDVPSSSATPQGAPPEPPA